MLQLSLGGNDYRRRQRGGTAIALATGVSLLLAGCSSGPAVASETSCRDYSEMAVSEQDAVLSALIEEDGGESTASRVALYRASADAYCLLNSDSTLAGLDGTESAPSAESTAVAATPNPTEEANEPSAAASGGQSSQQSPTGVVIEELDGRATFGVHSVVVGNKLFSPGSDTAVDLPPMGGEYWKFPQEANAGDDVVARAILQSPGADGLTAVTDSTQVQVSDATGAELWSYQLPEGYAGTVAGMTDVGGDLAFGGALVGDTLVLLTHHADHDDNLVLAGFDLATGAEKWRHVQSTSSVNACERVEALEPGGVATCWDNGVSAFDADTGNQLWRIEDEALKVGRGGLGSWVVELPYPAPSDGQRATKLASATTGEVFAEHVQYFAVDSTTGRVAISFVGPNGLAAGAESALIVLDKDQKVLFELSAAQAEGLDWLKVLGIYGDRMWVDTPAGIDIVNVFTGEHDPESPEPTTAAAFAGGARAVPEFTNHSFTLLRDQWQCLSGDSVCESESFSLVRHPDGPPEYGQLRQAITQAGRN